MLLSTHSGVPDQLSHLASFVTFYFHVIAGILALLNCGPAIRREFLSVQYASRTRYFSLGPGGAAHLSSRHPNGGRQATRPGEEVQELGTLPWASRGDDAERST